MVVWAFLSAPFSSSCDVDIFILNPFCSGDDGVSQPSLPNLIWCWWRFSTKPSKSGDDGVSMPRLPNLAMMAFLCQALKNMVMMAFLCQVFKIDDDGECFYAKSFKSGYDGVSLPSLPDLVNWTFLCLPSSPLVMWAFLCLPSSLPRCGRFSAPTPSPLWCGRFSSAPSPSSSFLLFSPAADF